MPRERLRSDLAKGQLTALITERDSLQASYDAGIASGEISRRNWLGCRHRSQVLLHRSRALLHRSSSQKQN